MLREIILDTETTGLDARTGDVVWHEQTAEPASAPLAAGDHKIFAPVGSSLEAIGNP